MTGAVSLEQRLWGHVPAASTRRVTRGSFTGAARGGLRARLDRALADAVLTFELDRFLYDVEVDALHAWLRQLVAFDAYCAARDAGGPPEPPVR